jgi:pimeloyl-ACP methyl ester carboxylesterase
MTLITQPLSDRPGHFAYQTLGRGAPLVLVHGVGMQSAAWAPQIAYFSDKYQVIALDMPGHGGSSPLDQDAQLVDFVDWLASVLTDLNLGPVALAGHSMGALIAGGLTISHPDLVERVALLNGVFRRDPAAQASVIARADQIKAGEFDLETPLSRWFGTGDIDQAARSKVSQWLSDVNLDGYATAYGAFARGDATYADRFDEIACPFLALTGDGDMNSSAGMAKTMADLVQNGAAHVIKGHRHMVNLTNPIEVNQALETWLAQPIKELQNV